MKTIFEKKDQRPEVVIATLRLENQCAIRICDNGGSVPANIVKKIFKPYYSTKNKKLGSGLGLYMSKIIMEDHHNGSLTMRNRNHGVCFEPLFNLSKQST